QHLPRLYPSSDARIKPRHIGTRLDPCRTHLVARRHPFVLGNHLLGPLINIRSSSGNLIDSELIEGPSLLDVSQGLAQLLKLRLDAALGLLGILNGFLLELLNLGDSLA